MISKIYTPGNVIRIFFFLISSIITTTLPAQVLPVESPMNTGLSADRLKRIDAAMNGYVKDGKMPGMVTMIVRHGKVAYFRSFGMKDIESQKVMTNDAIFRIASMSKAITSVAIMTLYEEGKFLLTDPVSKFIPEFRNQKVITKSPHSDSLILIPVKKEMTIRNLLNHTSGITYGEGVQEGIYRKAGMTVGLTPTEGTIGEMIRRLGSLPLISQPGEEFHYGMSTDVLGYLIEVISKMPLDEFLRKRIFEPLRMYDTYFSLPPEKYPRLATLYKAGNDGRLVPATGYVQYPKVQTYFSGGAGLLSTASDYSRFAQMLLNNGELDGQRILSRKTIELMTSNSLGDIMVSDGFRKNGLGDKFGYGFGIRTERGVFDELESPGIYGWDGAFYTRFWVDPEEDMIGIFFSQVDNYWNEKIIDIFRVLVYQSITD
jgi:CubicO group peptidase (beta-lactamase class C family)